MFFFSKLLLYNKYASFVDLHEYEISPDVDIHIKGHVSWVGSTSLEVSMRVEQVRFPLGLYIVTCCLVELPPSVTVA